MPIIKAPTEAGGGGAWTLVRYATATDASSISIASLDLATDKRYKVYVKFNNRTATGENFQMRINAKTADYRYAGRRSAWTTSLAYEDAGSVSAAGVNLDTGNTYKSQMAELDISLLNAGASTVRIFASFQVTSGGTASNVAFAQSYVGSGLVEDETNLTTLIFRNTSGNTTGNDWEVWIMKPNTA